MKSTQIEDNKIYKTPYKLRMACCDCGLVHDIQFGVVQEELYFTSKVNKRQTKKVREERNIRVEYEQD